MQFISPVMVLFFGWNYAAGLALYWLVASLFAMFQQYFVTGWGSLLVAPNLISNKTNGSNNNTKVVTSERVMTKADALDEGETSGSLNGKAKTYNNNSTAARRRTRNTSASARRRSSNNIPRRNPSRS
ncbi:MAG: hypothetical protein ABI406_11390, partial [Ktedonobacteraceae bacterium]